MIALIWVILTSTVPRRLLRRHSKIPAREKDVLQCLSSLRWMVDKPLSCIRSRAEIPTSIGIGLQSSSSFFESDGSDGLRVLLVLRPVRRWCVDCSTWLGQWVRVSIRACVGWEGRRTIFFYYVGCACTYQSGTQLRDCNTTTYFVSPDHDANHTRVSISGESVWVVSHVNSVAVNRAMGRSACNCGRCSLSLGK